MLILLVIPQKSVWCVVQLVVFVKIFVHLLNRVIILVENVVADEHVTEKVSLFLNFLSSQEHVEISKN